MQVNTKAIIKYCIKYLEADKWPDACVNGLQVEGSPKTSKIITGVSLSKELIEIAIRKRAKLILVHHGLFKSAFSPLPQVRGHMAIRLRLLLENNINLAGFHLPLDAHPVIGNNISLIKLMGMKKVGAIKSDHFGEIGFIGELPVAMKRSEFVETLNEKLDIKAYVIPGGPAKIKKVGVIAGGADKEYLAAKDMGADTYISGQLRESVVRAVEENKMNFINAGHYNTEKLGIQNLGELVAKKFGVKVEFVDIPNEI